MAQDIKSELEKQLKIELYNAGEYLKKCILKTMKNAFVTNPKVYKRTGQLEESLKLDSFANIQVVNNRLQIKVYFDEGAWHKSGNQIKGWSGNGKEINMAYYLNYGYTVNKDVWFKNIKNFGIRQPTYFVEEGIKLFNNSNKWKMYIDVNKDVLISSKSDYIR